MWAHNGKRIYMTRGDYGVRLPITITGATLAANDSINFLLINKAGAEVLSKSFSEITDNRVYLALTEAESARLPAGEYSYVVDWYQNGVFMCNIVQNGTFLVEPKREPKI